MRRNNKKKKYSYSGFSLLELIVVLAGLGILSSLAIPNYVRLLDFNNIDEAKSLLNTAAADCLQKSRLNDTDSRDLIDDEIISDKRLNTIGFKIDRENDADKCSYFLIQPTNDEDSIRYPIGFSVSEGKLTKFAEPTSSDKGSISSCENWAGINCKQDESLKKLIEYKKEIAAAKATCKDAYKAWLNAGTSPFKYDRWNSNAETGCPSRPPKDGSESYKNSTCTPNGCNQEVFGLDGEFVGYTEEDYDRALEAKYGRICTEWVAEKKAQIPPYTNDPIDEPQTKPECGEQEFWFAEGENQPTEEDMLKRLDEIKSDNCVADREQARKDGHIGKWGPFDGPGRCSEIVYMCNGYLYTDELEYYKTECELPPRCKNTITGDMAPRGVDPDCKNHEQTPALTSACGLRPTTEWTDPKRCRWVGGGSPSASKGGWDISHDCASWAKCMGYHE